MVVKSFPNLTAYFVAASVWVGIGVCVCFFFIIASPFPGWRNEIINYFITQLRTLIVAGKLRAEKMGEQPLSLAPIGCCRTGRARNHIFILSPMGRNIIPY